MIQTFAEKVIAFNRQLSFTGDLPEGFNVVNPFLDNPETMEVMQAFYQKYYNDNCERRVLIGINPGRHGAGVTGIPFTDTKRLESVCGIPMCSAHTHEVSSLFVYEMIEAYGVQSVLRFTSTPFPVGIIRQKPAENWVNELLR